MSVKTLMTAEELANLPEDDYRYELVEGELIRMSPTKPQHGKIAAKIIRILGNYVEAKGLGEVYGTDTGFIIRRHPDTVRAPDIAFVSRERIPEESGESFFSFSPDLAVEVLSPDESAMEVQDKIEGYFQGGSRVVWVVNPKTKTVTVYLSPSDIHVLTINNLITCGQVIPGLSFPVADIFR
ncbi:MAG: Uma2 family endonuclease [Candidatus Tectomicrobia bacterium]|uniref:Uma2 family endonuclease n=1 Tax=Tectimicrobiota bacterium TaxID=2528274 RepID=A0A933GKE1_UNCTE|nr:Uma2 family endonuclease [Candidatus Tectomicrobia bacterium]